MEKLVQGLVDRKVITNKRIAQVMAMVDRGNFVSDTGGYFSGAYNDSP